MERSKPSRLLPQDLYAALDHEVMLSHLKDAPWLCTKTASKAALLLKLLIGTDVLLLRGEVPCGTLLFLAYKGDTW